MMVLIGKIGMGVITGSMVVWIIYLVIALVIDRKLMPISSVKIAISGFSSNNQR
jgi:uncharacterized membrane protein